MGSSRRVTSAMSPVSCPLCRMSRSGTSTTISRLVPSSSSTTGCLACTFSKSSTSLRATIPEKGARSTVSSTAFCASRRSASAISSRALLSFALGLRGDALVVERLGALVLAACVVRLGLLLVEPRVVVPRIQAREDGARLDLLAFLDRERVELAGHLEGELSTLGGPDRAGVFAACAFAPAPDLEDLDRPDDLGRRRSLLAAADRKGQDEPGQQGRARLEHLGAQLHHRFLSTEPRRAAVAACSPPQWIISSAVSHAP